MNRSVSILAIALVSAPFLSAQETQPAAAMKRATMDIVDTAANAGTFKTLLTAAKAAGLVDTLKSKGPLTVFAPTDEAFAKLPEGTVEALLKDPKKLATILTYHVVAGRVTAADLIGKSWAPTVEGQSLRVAVEGDDVMIDNAKVVKADIAASNGLIHVIDTVVLPRADIVATAIEAGSFKTLAKALTAAGLVETLQGKGPFTVFAPTDEAFAKLPAETLKAVMADKAKLTAILTYHVVAGRVLAEDLPQSKMGKPSAEPKTVQGEQLTIIADEKNGVTVNGAKVVKANVLAGNGVIHVIDTVLLPK